MKQITASALYTFFSGFLFCCLVSTAQSSGDKNHRNSFFADYSTASNFVSLNYDRVFGKRRYFSKSFRVGFSAAKNSLGIPVGIQLFNGHGNNHLELSLVLIPFIEDSRYLFTPGNWPDKKLYIIPGIGYRYQQPAGGFFFKSVAAPVLLLDPDSDNIWKMKTRLFPSVSIGAGYSF